MLFEPLISQIILITGLEEYDQVFAIEVAVMAAKRVSQILPANTRTDDANSMYDMPGSKVQ